MSIVEKKSLVYAVCDLSLLPHNLAVKHFDPDDILGQIGYRLAHVVQFITSLIALPILLFIGVLEAAIRLGLCDAEGSLTAFQATARTITGTALCLPAALLVSCTPIEMGDCIRIEFFERAKLAMKVWDCTCSSNEDASFSEDYANLDFLDLDAFANDWPD